MPSPDSPDSPDSPEGGGIVLTDGDLPPDAPPPVPMRGLPYLKVLTQKAAQRTSIVHRGNEVLDTLAVSRPRHVNLFNVSWWPQARLNLYTPQFFFKAAHSVLQDSLYPTPIFLDKTYPVVTWKRVSGATSARSVVPDGTPAVAALKVMEDGPDGSAWAYATANLGEWGGGLGAKTGQFDLNRGIAVIVTQGQNDLPITANLPDAPGEETPAQRVARQNSGRRGDVRVMVGNLWSVKLHGDGSAPTFEKKASRAKNGGLRWDVLHTFSGAAPTTEGNGQAKWIVTFAKVGFAITISVSGRDINESSYAYTERDPRRSGELKDLQIPSAPVVVSGITGGGPIWLGLRRIVWGSYGYFENGLEIGDAADAPQSYLLPPVRGQLIPFGSSPPIGGGRIITDMTMTSKTHINYRITLYSSGGREAACIKWVMFKSNKDAVSVPAEYLDYAPAVLNWQEQVALPDFSGVGGTRGSDYLLNLKFDIYKLDKIAAENNTDWRKDLDARAPVTFIQGEKLLGADCAITDHEVTRVTGFIDLPRDGTRGFQASDATRSVRDYSFLLKEPAAIVEREKFLPLSVVLPANGKNFYGWEAVKYILGKAIDPVIANKLRVYMPRDWYPLLLSQFLVGVTGKLPAQDVPLFNPPYGKYAAEWLASDICPLDFAALYFAGDTPIYGQFQEIIRGLPTWDVYDATTEDAPASTGDAPDNPEGGTVPGGLPLPTETMPIPPEWFPFLTIGSESELRTEFDFNQWKVWGKPPGGLGDDAEKFGVPLVEATATDFEDAAKTWVRTKLFQGGQFYDQAQADRFVSEVKRLSGGRRAAKRYRLEFGYGLPEVFWGHKFRIHGCRDTSLNGKVLRVVRMAQNADMVAPEIKTTVSCVEVLPET